MCYCVVVKIKLLKDCEMPIEVLAHPGNGCDCTHMVPGSFSENEIIEGWQIDAKKVDISGLTYKVDYEIIEYP